MRHVVNTSVMPAQKRTCDRRTFITTVAAGTAALLLPWRISAQDVSAASLVLVRGGNREEALAAALEVLGGISQFAPRGKTVVVKPNIGWDRLPEQGANTDPDLVAALVKVFVNHEAKVKVFDSTCNAAQRCYRRSGIEAAAKSAGAKVSYVNEKRFRTIKLPRGKVLQSWPVYKDYLEADLRVNVPILKHHSLAGLSMGLKNLMGVMGDPRPSIHREFDRKLIDITQGILPELTVLDARRVLRRNGPQGGNPDDVEVMNCLIAGFDPVAVDGEGARLFGTDPRSLPYLVEAENRGLGSLDRPDDFREIVLPAAKSSG